MNTKISKLFAGALLTGLWACSSDEPAYIPSQGDGKAYLAVDIMDANSNTRAGEFEDGTEAENKVHTSLFVFFDASGHFMCTGTIQSGEFTKPGQNESENGNVESIGKNIIVVSGLNGIDFPRYMMTILNNPEGLEDKIKNEKLTMSQTESLVLDYVPAPGTPFIMTTSSHLGNDSMVTDVSNYSLMTKLPEDLSQISDENWVRVYVERLSAGVDLAMYEGKTSFDLDGSFQTGAYDNDGKMQFTTKNLKVKIDGWGLNSTARQTFLSKDIDGLASPLDNTWEWDNSKFHRSYWGKSVCYGDDLKSNYVYLGDSKVETPYTSDNHTLQYFNWDQLTNQVHTSGFTGGTRAYCLENTNTVAKITSGSSLLAKNVTCAIVKATLTDEEGNAVNAIRYQGVLFERDSFVPYALSLAKNAGYLPFYTITSTSTDAEGNVTNVYTQLTPEHFVLKLSGKGTGVVTLYSKIPEGTNVYRKVTGNNDKTAYELVEDHSKIDDSVQSVVGTAMAYTNGSMFYVVPIKHLRALGTSIAEGNYGIVRNHLYQITVGNIAKLGNGVFEPGTEDDVNPGEPIIPDDPNPDFYLSARINILAWRVVDQYIDF